MFGVEVISREKSVSEGLEVQSSHDQLFYWHAPVNSILLNIICNQNLIILECYKNT